MSAKRDAVGAIDPDFFMPRVTPRPGFAAQFAAQRVCAGYARDAGDLADLLDVLDLRTRVRQCVDCAAPIAAGRVRCRDCAPWRKP